MRRGFAAVTFVVCVQAITWACSSRIPPAVSIPREVASDECTLIAGPGEPVTTVGLPDAVDPAHAPYPSNDSERLLFRQLYETLVTADCNGRVGPGLATSWRLEDDRRRWLVTLREGALFSDGTPVTAADVRASWNRGGVDGELRPNVARFVESVVMVDDRSLTIVLRNHRTDAPLALAHSALAIARSGPGSPWPLGTRASRALPDAEPPRTAAASVIALTRDNLPSIRFLIGSGDARDLLDQDVDLLITRDPAALDYASTLPQFDSVPLAWQRLHVLLAPGRLRPSPSLSESARQALASDAIRGEARGAQGPFWWESATCEAARALPRSQSSPPAPRIVYDAGDSAARDLAERFVGLARASDPGAATFLDVLLPDRPRRTYQRASALVGEVLAQTRRLGRDAGYIASVDSRPLEPCRDVQELMDTAPWLDPGTIVPLVETRMKAIVRRGRAGLTAEWNGGLVIGRGSNPSQK